MAFVAGEVAVNFLAKTLGFDRNLKKSGKQVKAFQQDVKGLDKAASLLTDTLGIGLSVGGFAAMVNQTIATAKEMKTLATRTGLSAQMFQAYAAQARAAGQDSQKLADAIHDMNERIGEFAIHGTGEGAEAFKVLGLAAHELIDLDVPGRLELIIGKIKDMGNLAKETSLVNQIFGGAGAELVLSDFSNNLEAAKESADAFLSDEQIDRLAKLKTGYEKLKNVGMLSFAKELDAVTEAAANLAKELGGAPGKGKAGTAPLTAFSALRRVMDDFSRVGPARRADAPIGLSDPRAHALEQTKRIEAEQKLRKELEQSAAAERRGTGRGGGVPLSVQGTRGGIGAMSTRQSSQVEIVRNPQGEKMTDALREIKRVIQEQTVVFERGFEAETDTFPSELN